MSCPECVSGSLHEGTPKGSEVKIANIDAYVIGAEDSNRIIIVGTDIFGWKLVNTRLLADEYAAKGFRVIVPDLFNGSALPMWTLKPHDPAAEHKSLFTRLVLVPASLFLLVPYVLRNQPRSRAVVATVTAELRATHPRAKIGYVGFCWGGRFAFTHNGLFDATAACHPSLVRFPAELAGIARPFSLAAAATDPQFDRARARETERILRERGLQHVQVVVYEGVKHGWAVRADVGDESEKAARDEAVAQVLGWFEKYLSVSSDDAPGVAVVTGEQGPASDAAPTVEGNHVAIS